MANQNLFRTSRGPLPPTANTVNEAGGVAFAFSAEHALAQLAATGCLHGTYYASAEQQLATVLELAGRVDAELLAQTAIFARRRGHMRDMPAVMLAVLSLRDPKRLAAVFDRVIDNGRMLRTFVQVMRSGVVGRKSLGTRPKKLVRSWLASRSDAYLFRQSVGNAPSLADVVKMVHPKPANDSRRALFGYLMDKPHDTGALPELVREFEAFKAGDRTTVPQVPFQMLTALELGRREWCQIAKHASWTMTRMNLNTFARHGVFEDPELVAQVAARLADEELVARAKVFPYQLLVAFRSASEAVPRPIKDALRVAMEHALANVPMVEGDVWICPDVSGSMRSPVTGWRRGGTSKVQCVEVAALFAAALLRANTQARVLPFENAVVPIELDPMDTVMTNAAKLALIGGGGTRVSAPLARINQLRANADLVVVVSDNQSWMDPRRHGSTQTMAQWETLKQRCPDARLVCIDLQPYTSTQAPDREDILNVGGFSDQVFDTVAAFAVSHGRDHWLDQIRAISI